MWRKAGHHITVLVDRMGLRYSYTRRTLERRWLMLFLRYHLHPVTRLLRKLFGDGSTLYKIIARVLPLLPYLRGTVKNDVGLIVIRCHAFRVAAPHLGKHHVSSPNTQRSRRLHQRGSDTGTEKHRVEIH